MKVWLLFRIEPYETDEFIDVFVSFEAADKARYERRAVPHDYDHSHVIYSREVQK